MKPARKIVILFSAGYLLSLQMLFGLHALQHETENIPCHNEGFSVTLQAPDCSFCDLFFDQTAESVFTNQETITHFCNYLFSIETEQLNLLKFFSACLRGPPAVIL